MTPPPSSDPTGILRDNLASEAGLRLDAIQPVSGGDIARAYRLRLQDGRLLFAKLMPGMPAGMAPAEAEGLRLLAQGGCRVPEVVAVWPGGLVLDWIERGPATTAYQEALGRGLAAQHRITRPTFGGSDSFLGPTPQPSPATDDAVAFWRDHRLGHMQRLLREAHVLTPVQDASLDALRSDLGRWLHVPGERPALVHGDLWGGNTMPGPRGEPFVFDPAVAFSLREADLAMAALFGGFGDRFWSAYEEAFPLPPGAADRRPLLQLYHLLHHALLFGGGYLRQAMDIVHRFVG